MQSGEISFVAKRHIREGEPLCISYIDDSKVGRAPPAARQLPRSQRECPCSLPRPPATLSHDAQAVALRQEALSHAYGFRCRCQRCLEEEAASGFSADAWN